jgi:predicted dienelactone hydrolase
MNVELVSRPRHIAVLLAATLALGLIGQLPDPARAEAAGQAADLRVGHTVKHIVVKGSAAGEDRQVEVHLWYPADKNGLSDRPKAVYRSALYGKTLIPGRWDPLSWQVESEVARENASIDRGGPAFPVIVFSHGSTNDPIDYAHTLELIAGAGFVVAAPAHVNNTQDDERIDFINAEAAKIQPGLRLFDCRDGRPSPCSRANVARSMEDRVRDISGTLDALPGWLGDRVDVLRAGVLGHSRGSVTALAAVGGSDVWGFGPLRDRDGNPRVKAIMGLAIGARNVTSAANLANVTVPAVLVAGGLDRNSVQAVSEDAFDAISSAEKLLVTIPNATHRSFDSTYCPQLQSAAAIAQLPNGQVNPRAVLDLHTVRLIGTSFPGGLSGKAHEYCSADTFSSPDLTGLMTSFNGLKYVDGQGRPTGETFTFEPGAPTTGLETDEVKDGVTELAVSFFGTVLKGVGNDGSHFTRFLAPKWLQEHEPMVGDAQAFAGADAICPPGQEVVCAD